MPALRDETPIAAAATGECASALAEWLLTGPAQLTRGPEAGAVAGTLDAHDAAAYVYPEITGYYLQWLAWQATRQDADGRLATRAAAAQRWLARWVQASTPPATRLYLSPAPSDWRNGATFLFDVAMVVRGLASAVRLRLVAPDPALVRALVRELRGLVAADGAFDACAPSAPGVVLPVRWSTQRGAFLAKAAAGIIDAATVLPDIPDDIAVAAEATYARSLDALVEAPHPEVHPLLYAFEGILSLPAHPRFAAILPRVASQFDALLALAQAGGGVPESVAAGAPAVRRVDVVAQALRVGIFLDLHLPGRPRNRIALDRLSRTLADQVVPGRGMPFARDDAIAPANVWATMFAEQALALASPAPGSRTRTGADTARLLV
jgi:hypothetical protein